MKQWLMVIVLPLLCTIATPQTPDSSLNSAVNFNELQLDYDLTVLNKTTPIPLQYHPDIKKYIDLFITKRKTEFGKILGRSERYFPVFEAYLDKHQLPLELKYLAIVESSLIPTARSSSGALGLWQFKINSGKMFDLTINSYIDERLDLYASTEAACKYINYLYTTFNDWLLAISAYNGGPGVVRNAIERANGNTNYWEIREFMTEETKNYVPAFIAAYYVMHYHESLNIEKANEPVNQWDLDTVQISYPITFQQITEVTGIPQSMLEELNPIYKLHTVPGDKTYPLILPTNYLKKYLRNETKIRAQKNSVPNYIDLLNEANNTKNKIKITHEVKKGEFFHKIALQYNCTIENLKAWNKLTENTLHPGQILDIWIAPENDSINNLK